jgi:DNA (cytosine-5)-methyltransferase 1
MRFVDLFAGMGGFHVALSRLGHECAFACEIDDELRDLYKLNFPESSTTVYDDIRLWKHKVPEHDVLCAGFPCQPFSKSGAQRGLHDKTRGTLFDEILFILEKRRPPFVILENVGNFERHDKGNTWRTVHESLKKLNYDVRGTEHLTSGGHGLISPHHLGFPQYRERFFIVASQHGLPLDPFPRADRKHVNKLAHIVQPRDQLTTDDLKETALSEQQKRCIDHWNSLLANIPDTWPLPSFPIWGDELGATYPFVTTTPFATTARQLRQHVAVASRVSNKQELMEALPSYARTNSEVFPEWKVRFIQQNRDWFESIRKYVPKQWHQMLRGFPASLRKLEWNCKGETRDLWEHVLQFRPSGLRVKRYNSSPALVAMTTTQIPLLGPERRFITRREGLKLQGFSEAHHLPKSREAAFRALGNAVHVGVVAAIATRLLGGDASQLKTQELLELELTKV